MGALRSAYLLHCWRFTRHNHMVVAFRLFILFLFLFKTLNISQSKNYKLYLHKFFMYCQRCIKMTRKRFPFNNIKLLFCYIYVLPCVITLKCTKRRRSNTSIYYIDRLNAQHQYHMPIPKNHAWLFLYQKIKIVSFFLYI